MRKPSALNNPDKSKPKFNLIHQPHPSPDNSEKNKSDSSRTTASLSSANPNPKPKIKEISKETTTIPMAEREGMRADKEITD